MRTISKIICTIGIIGVLLVAGATYLCTHGIQENGWLSVSMTSSSSPMNSSLVGRTIPIDGKTSIKVTAISENLNADDSVESYRIHADVLCRSKQWFSLNDRSWKQVFLASSQQVHEALRAEATLPNDAVTLLNSELLLPQ